MAANDRTEAAEVFARRSNAQNNCLGGNARAGEGVERSQPSTTFSSPRRRVLRDHLVYTSGSVLLRRLPALSIAAPRSLRSATSSEGSSAIPSSISVHNCVSVAAWVRVVFQPYHTSVICAHVWVDVGDDMSCINFSAPLIKRINRNSAYKRKMMSKPPRSIKSMLITLSPTLYL